MLQVNSWTKVDGELLQGSASYSMSAGPSDQGASVFAAIIIGIIYLLCQP